MNMETIGDRLRRLRRSKEVSQKELSQQINCHQTLISKYERNMERPTMDNVMTLARFYGVSTDYLLHGDVVGPDTNVPSDTSGRLASDDADGSVTVPPSNISANTAASTTAWPDLAHTLAKALQMHEETARIQAEAMKLQAENDRLRIEKVDAIAQDNLRRLLDRLDQMAVAQPHSPRRDDEAAASGHQALVG